MQSPKGRRVTSDRNEGADVTTHLGAPSAIPAPVHDDDDVRGWFRSHVVHACELRMAEDDSGRPTGILVLDDDWVDQLYVDPEQTSRGIGSRLLAVAKR